MSRMVLLGLPATVVFCVCAFSQDATTPRELRNYSTIHCIGIEWDISGDNDHDASCTVAYRANGQDTWKKALPLFRIDYQWWYAEEKAKDRSNMFAGSILFLRPDTTYEVKLELWDPDGGAATEILQVRTRLIPTLPQGGRTWHVIAGNGGGTGSTEDPFRGLAAAQAAAGPADIVLLHAGQYGVFTFDKSGTPAKYIVWRHFGDEDAVFNHIKVAASHIWLEGLTLNRGQQSNGLRAIGNPADVVIKRNHFSGLHYSILLSPDSRNWYIADNVIVGDNDPLTKGTAAMSGEGVELNHSSGHVVCHNCISCVADGISYPGENVDIFSNDIFDVSDDGLEPDYAYANVRMWGNRISNFQYAGLSFQPMRCGPWYFIRNQVIGRGQIFKFRVQDRFLLANNTFVRWGSIGDRMHHILTSISRNNLYISVGTGEPVWVAIDCKQPQYCLPNNYQPNWMTDVDYDGFDWGTAKQAFRWENRKNFADLSSFAQAIGIEEHGIRVRKEEIFEQFNLPMEPAHLALQYLTLKPGCNAIDAGVVLPNINEDFEGFAPDLGAYEFGTPLSNYGPRPPG